jgi:hypothetical protein
MANTDRLEVTEGQDGEFVLTVKDGNGNQIPVHTFYLEADGGGAAGAVERVGAALKTYIDGQDRKIDINSSALGSTGDSSAQNSQDDATAIALLKWLGFLLNNGATVQGGTSEGNAPNNAPVFMAGRYDVNPSSVSDGELVALATNEVGQIVMTPQSATEDSIEAVESKGTVMYQGSEYVVNLAEAAYTSLPSGSELIASSTGDDHILLDLQVTWAGANQGDRLTFELSDGTNRIMGVTGTSGAVRDTGQHVGTSGDGNPVNVTMTNIDSSGLAQAYVQASYITV